MTRAPRDPRGRRTPDPAGNSAVEPPFWRSIRRELAGPADSVIEIIHYFPPPTPKNLGFPPKNPEKCRLKHHSRAGFGDSDASFGQFSAGFAQVFGPLAPPDSSPAFAPHSDLRPRSAGATRVDGHFKIALCNNYADKVKKSRKRKSATVRYPTKDKDAAPYWAVVPPGSRLTLAPATSSPGGKRAARQFR